MVQPSILQEGMLSLLFSQRKTIEYQSYIKLTMPILEDAENDLTPLSREIFAERYTQLVALDKEIKVQDQRMSALCKVMRQQSDFLKCPVLGL